MRHGIANTNVRPMCLEEVETIEHLLVDCPFARVIWFEVFSDLGRPDHAPPVTAMLEVVVA